MLKDCNCIDLRALEIINFWFGGDQQINYRTKWFPEGSSEKQANIDFEIYTHYGTLLESAIHEELTNWKQYRTSCLALIILFDQFSRHIYRHLQEPSPSPLRQQTDQLALEIAKYFHSFPDIIIDLPVAEYVFSLMPLRHNQSIDHLQIILTKLTEKEESTIKGDELLQRFRKQTTRRLQHLQDRQRLEATEDILERHPFQADETNILKESLILTTETFIKKNLSSPPYASSSSEKNNKKRVIKNILMISLSGGVDSMVISKILAVLKKTKKLPIDEIVAIHIDYANRPESTREATYVDEWSRSLGIHCRIRVVNEVTRGITDRDLYEKVSRNIRYSFYQECIQAALQGEFDTPLSNTESTENIEYHVSGIMFGHHLGDVQENVISNVMRGSSPLDLSGMTETSYTNNVYVWRPLLSHVKDDIYQFAHQYGVPYFKDSTPSWSTRGKLRNQLIPLLIEIYGEGCLRNLSNLAIESDNTQDLVYSNLYKPFFDSVRRSSCGLLVNIVPYRHQPQCFWKEILKQLMHSLSMSMIRDKAVSNFVERLQRTTIQQLQKQQKSTSKPTSASSQLLSAGWLELRKGYHTYLNEANDLIVIKDGVLRKNLVVYNPATTKNQMMQSKDKLNAASSSPASKVLASIQEPAGNSLIELSFPTTVFRLSNEITLSPDVSTLELDKKQFENTSLPHSHDLQYDSEHFLSLTKLDYGSEYETSADFHSSSPSNEAKVLQFGPWKITILLERIFSANDATDHLMQNHSNINNKKNGGKIKLLKNVEDILADRFSYKIFWPFLHPSASSSSSSTAAASVDCTFVFLKDFLQLFEQFIVSHRTSNGEGAKDVAGGGGGVGIQYYSLAQHFYHEETTLFPDIINALSFDLKSMELRLRDGLPILIPCFLQKESGLSTDASLRLINNPSFFDEWNENKHYLEFSISYEFNSLIVSSSSHP